MSEKKSEESMMQLQMIEQNLQTFLMQKQQFHVQLNEISSALDHLKDAKKTYKIIANIMVDASRDEVEQDLKKKKEMLEVRMKSLEKQEQALQEKSQKLQQEVTEK